MNDIFSPATGEHIRTETPCDWMGRAGKPAPDYDPAIEWCFWRGGHWEIVQGQASLDSSWAEYQSRAKTALTQSDITLLRCVENGIIVPAAWAAYRQELRAILSASSGDANQTFPVRPDYPAGT